jgi:hypothetical protein
LLGEAAGARVAGLLLARLARRAEAGAGVREATGADWPVGTADACFASAFVGDNGGELTAGGLERRCDVVTDVGVGPAPDLLAWVVTVTGVGRLVAAGDGGTASGAVVGAAPSGSVWYSVAELNHSDPR